MSRPSEYSTLVEVVYIELRWRVSYFYPELSSADETDSDVEIMETQQVGKRKGTAKSLPPSKHPKLEIGRAHV